MTSICLKFYPNINLFGYLNNIGLLQFRSFQFAVDSSSNNIRQCSGTVIIDTKVIGRYTYG